MQDLFGAKTRRKTKKTAGCRAVGKTARSGGWDSGKRAERKGKKGKGSTAPAGAGPDARAGRAFLLTDGWAAFPRRPPATGTRAACPHRPPAPPTRAAGRNPAARSRQILTMRQRGRGNAKTAQLRTSRSPHSHPAGAGRARGRPRRRVLASGAFPMPQAFPCLRRGRFPFRLFTLSDGLIVSVVLDGLAGRRPIGGEQDD